MSMILNGSIYLLNSWLMGTVSVLRNNLHWLPVRMLIDYKVETLAHFALLNKRPREATHSGTRPALISHRPSPTCTPVKIIDLKESLQLRSTCGLERTAGNHS